jgi:hypothetical protein
MAEKLTRLTHKIAIQLHLVAHSDRGKSTFVFRLIPIINEQFKLGIRALVWCRIINIPKNFVGIFFFVL